jgi:gliding motility-associated lipoprotein GldH
MSKKLLVVAVFVTILSACMQTGLYEKITFMPAQEWEYAFQPEFKFEITDTASAYRLYFLFRHNNTYAFNNLWVSVDSQLPGDSVIRTERFEFKLASGQKWLGTGMDDIFDHRILLYKEPVRFSNPGTYTVRFRQDMRTDPLEHVLNAGLRLEKAN